MVPIIVDPTSYDKAIATQQAVELVNGFLDLNGIPRPKRFITEIDKDAKPPGKNPWHDYGFYWQGTIFANVKKSRVPVKTPGFSWTFTGSKADLTAPGIIAHEHTHYVHHHLEEAGGKVIRIDMLNALNKLIDDEEPLSGYEPNVYELMAEAGRLFILNPTLLKAARPLRYQTLCDFGLKPCHDTHWREVLKHAHPRFITMLENWIKRAL